MGTIDDKLKELGIDLPTPPSAIASYVPFVVTGNLVFISGQLSAGPDGPVTGQVGDDISLKEAQEAARFCGLNIIAQLKLACEGDLDRVKRCVRLGGFVSCGPDFNVHPKVINGASDLMLEVFGEAGRHARAAVGSSSLPLGVAVEVDAVFEIE